MKKVLIVDDEPAIRFLIRATLEDEGYMLDEAADGMEALKRIAADKPDLIILDVMMPEMTGYELCQKLKADPATRGMVIIMLTAKGQEQDRLQSQRIGADDYIRKPFSPLELIDRVAAALG
ncbi:response regulator receiver domain-containing protein [Hydrogenispora ethanolica]|uniref:Response regulator receiver domain-containing protein n=1 Tax=Hydrogenispora ethanolica TaxID=1082276 RepID=A0A4R1S190_HYDET|nr:response regulator [Hydrogenispora ethanolica]TCL72300.1 response regulator receiver domain-containing protein [Hydrogenispora ethanolica]